MNPAIFIGDDCWFQLSIERYQFPEITYGDWDCNWLIIKGQVRLGGEEWTFHDPCLTTFEAERLADWLEAVASGAPDDRYCDFVEPNLQFDLVEESSLRISFALESVPTWAKLADRTLGFNVCIGPALVEAAKALRAQLKDFPVRGINPIPC